jgi:hypothetical protein
VTRVDLHAGIDAMTDPQRHATIGPRTRPLLEKAGVPQKYLDGIEAGGYTWSIQESTNAISSASLDALNRQAREAAGKPRDYTITIYPTEENEDQFEEFGDDGIAVYGVSHHDGQQIVWNRDLDAAGTAP